MGSYAEAAYRGDNPSYSFTVTNGGVAVDITGFVFFLTIKPAFDADDTDAAAVVSETWTVPAGADATNGLTSVTISLADVDPGDYFWDVQMKDASNNIKTLIVDNYRVVDDVTRRTS